MSLLYANGTLPKELYQHSINTCEKQGAKDLDWRNACLELGRLMEDTGKTFISVRVGLGIQRDMLGFTEEDKAALQAVERRRAFTHRWRVLAAEKFEDVRALVNAPDEYYEDLFQHDEIYARNQAFERISGVPDP